MNVPKDIDKYFYNRKKELIQLKTFISSLNENVSNQILLTGFRGIGKSFFLENFITTLPENILSVYIDISVFYGLFQGKLSELEVMKGLLEEINNTIKNHDYGLKKIHKNVSSLISKLKNQDYDFRDAGSILSIPIPEVNDNYEKLSRFTLEFPQKIVDSSKGKIKGFVIIIDEFQFLGELKSPDAFFWLIRSFTQKQDNVSYIFTGSTSTTSEMVEKINGMDGAFGSRMIQMNLEPFSKDTTKNYIKEKISDINFTDKGFERFYKCTRGYPAYINSFCNTISPNKLYNEEDIINEFYNKIDQIAIRWITIWSSLSKQEKNIVTTLIDNESLKWNELVEKVPYSDSTVSMVLKKLKNKGIVSHFNALYSVDDYMLASWLKHRKHQDSYYPL
ncbi:MAG: ATP-binding protein [Methanobrevibacter sp.]|jgi:DNA-binding MarR family transcriptional regulator|nr:ATP-binding protein [Methanobrevibacter sp.]